MALSIFDIIENLYNATLALRKQVATTLFLCFVLATPLCQAQQSLNDIEYYLNSISTFTANFKQYSSNGEIRHGKFWLSKPGKIKWEYSSPRKIAIIGNGKSIVYCDYDLEEVSYIPSKSVLAHFLSKERINLSQDVHVDQFISGSAYSELRLSESNTSEQQSNIAQLVLKFEHKPINKLVEVDVIDQNGQEIEILFTDVKLNSNIDPSIFIFRNPKFFSNSR